MGSEVIDTGVSPLYGVVLVDMLLGVGCPVLSMKRVAGEAMDIGPSNQGDGVPDGVGVGHDSGVVVLSGISCSGVAPFHERLPDGTGVGSVGVKP